MIELDDLGVAADFVVVVEYSDHKERWDPTTQETAEGIADRLRAAPPPDFVNVRIEDTEVVK